MKAADLKFNLVDSYLGLLKNLSPESKIELISKLSDSLNEPKGLADKSVKELYGSFTSKKSADEIIKELKASRNFNRSIPEL